MKETWHVRPDYGKENVYRIWNEYDAVDLWDCAFYKESKSDGGGAELWSTAATAPHAICLAALKAVEVR